MSLENRFKTPKPQRISVGFRLDSDVYNMLQALCEINQRSQRELVETMIYKYHEAWKNNPSLRINP